MLPWAGSTNTPSSATTSARITRQRCDRLTCKPGRRCAEHRAGAQPQQISELFADVLRRAGGAR